MTTDVSLNTDTEVNYADVKLKNCPCGGEAKCLIISEASTHRWRFVSADCSNKNCPEWQIEVRVSPLPANKTVELLCIEAWNKAARAGDET
jgi:hypothetical protein